VQRIDFLRSSFSRSSLVRLLDAWTPAEAEASGMDFAERLSLWLNTFDAIHLQAAQQAIRALPAAAPARPSRPPRAAELAADLERVRGTLARAIAQDPLTLDLPPPPEHPRLRTGAAKAAPAAEDPGYAAFLQRHLDLQRQMELMIEPLREHVRQALGRGSPGLRQLAALDAALEPVLARHAQALLPTLPARLKRRFEQLRRRHQAEAVANDGAPPPPADWLQAFGQDWRQALLAELDLRLEPVVGLIEAASNESNLQR
jgi:hypothetical protein